MKGLHLLSLQLAEERISNMRTVRAFGKELSEVNKYTQKTDLVFSLAKKEAVVRAGFFGVVSTSSQLINNKTCILLS